MINSGSFEREILKGREERRKGGREERRKGRRKGKETGYKPYLISLEVF